MGINTLRFINYEESDRYRDVRSEGAVCCWYPDL